MKTAEPKPAMTRLTAKNPSAKTAASQQPRREGRVRVKADAAIGKHGADMNRACLQGLSPHGCNVRTGTSAFGVGEFVIIRFDGTPGIKGIVRWVRDGEAGIEFTSSLDNAVVDRLAFEGPALLAIETA